VHHAGYLFYLAAVVGGAAEQSGEKRAVIASQAWMRWLGSVKLRGQSGNDMDTVNIHQAKTHLSRLVEEAAEGTEIVIAKNGVPRAKLVPLAASRPLKFGVLKGKIRYPDDFDAPLPAAILTQFEGRRAR
jgi:prevent-host-death family protein